MWKRAAVAAAVLMLLGAACGNNNDNKKGGGGGSRYDVNVDGKTSAFHLGTTAFFPNQIGAHAGDTIVFHEVWTGEPHTVAMGTLVDAAAKAVKANPQAQEDPAELKKLPDVFPAGPGDANQSAAQPCFLAAGDPPASDACTKAQQVQPAFNGRQTFYDSGFLPEDSEFTVKLASDLAPGAYSFMCMIHRAGMMGTLNVVPNGKLTTTPAQIKKAGEVQLDLTVKALTPVYAQMKTATPDQALAGSGVKDIQNAFVTEFGPEDSKVAVGGTVSWTVLGPHTISLGDVPQDASPVLVKSPDGAWHLNQKGLTPAGGAAGAPPPGGGPPKPVTVDGGTFNGTGYFNSGAILSFPPALVTYKVKFSKAGTYNLKCTIHPDMQGKVIVG
jgi:plastocyanin